MNIQLIGYFILCLVIAALVYDRFNLKKKAQSEDEDGQYSRDADQTRFIWMAFSLAQTTLIGLFCLEFFHPVDSPVFFTAEINHILVNGLGIGFLGIGAYIFGKNVGANEALAKMAGGGNGHQQGNSPTETKPQPKQ